MPLLTIAKTLRFITQHPLNRGRPWAAVRRYLAWQIASRLAPGAIAVNWVGGTRLLTSTGDLTANIYCGLFDYEEMAFLLHLLRPGDRFADIGANAGSWTVLAGGVAGAECWAFEPAPAAYRKLIDNIRLNGLETHIRAFNVAVGECRGKTHFATGLNCMNHVVAADEKVSSIEVETVTLDEIFGADAPTLMKIDVEGFETDVLRGATRLLADPRLQAIVIELIGCGNRYGYNEMNLVRLLSENRFLPYQYTPQTAELVPSVEAGATPGDFIFIRDLAWVQERLAARPEISFWGTNI